MNQSMSKILIIDADEKNRILMEGALGLRGYRVMTASNGKEGWALLKSQSPDLVILDVILPEMSGVEIVHHIRNFEAPLCNVPILVMMVKKNMKYFFSDFKFIDFLIKPIMPEELLVKVKGLSAVKGDSD